MAVAEPIRKPLPRSIDSSRPPTEPESRPDRNSTPDGLSLLNPLLALVVLSLLAWLAYKVATGKYYTPRSAFGFYLGVGGSVTMLAMLLYPLRKHVRALHRWGALKNWFRWHMIMGIAGPALILFHSTFHLRSLNATIALISMLIMVASGVIGRFVYTKIHYGLYGRRATLERVQQEFACQADDMRSRFHRAPRVEQWLTAFEREANHVERSAITMWWSVAALGWKRRLCSFRCGKELRSILGRERSAEFPGGAQDALHLANRYLREAERVAEFTTYERIFSLWHILHIPLIYLLAASTIFHIIAVYMY
ncbi:MAG: hypothetical protein RI101_10050 [Nitrospira sp.]|jgi:hypothetical protein|nr:hypothetical protein [Nitrospira sp.]